MISSDVKNAEYVFSLSKVTVLTCGSSGKYITNPMQACGDGYVLTTKAVSVMTGYGVCDYPVRQASANGKGLQNITVKHISH